MGNFLSCLLLTSLIAVPGLLRADETVIEEIVVRVNNQIITQSEYLHGKEELRKEVQQQDPVNADKIVAERDKDVLRDLIDQQLLLEKGKDLGITADTDVIKKLDEMRKDMKLDSMEELEKAAQSQGISFEDFKQNLRNQIITQQVIGKEVGSRLVISKEDEQKFYDQHKSELERPETIRLSEILVSTDPKRNGFRPLKPRRKTCLPRFARALSSKMLPRKTPMGPPPHRVGTSANSSAARWPSSSRTKPSP